MRRRQYPRLCILQGETDRGRLEWELESSQDSLASMEDELHVEVTHAPQKQHTYREGGYRGGGHTAVDTVGLAIGSLQVRCGHGGAVKNAPKNEACSPARARS